MNSVDRFWWGVGWGIVAVAVWFSLGPQALDNGLPQGDKWNHLAGYGALMVWFAQLPLPRARLALACLAFGVLLELAQGLTPNRQPDTLDALANAGGVALGWLAARLLPNFRIRLAGLRRAPNSTL